MKKLLLFLTFLPLFARGMEKENKEMITLSGAKRTPAKIPLSIAKKHSKTIKEFTDDFPQDNDNTVALPFNQESINFATNLLIKLDKISDKKKEVRQNVIIHTYDNIIAQSLLEMVSIFDFLNVDEKFTNNLIEAIPKCLNFYIYANPAIKLRNLINKNEYSTRIVRKFNYEAMRLMCERRNAKPCNINQALKKGNYKKYNGQLSFRKEEWSQFKDEKILSSLNGLDELAKKLDTHQILELDLSHHFLVSGDDAYEKQPSIGSCFPQLTKLSLKDNNISIIDSKFLGNLTNLKILDLHMAGIKKIYPKAINAPHLTELDLALNNISNLNFLKHLTKLIKLNISFNNIKKIPHNLPTSLQELRLNNNNILSIPKEFNRLTNLTSLDISKTCHSIQLEPNAFEKIPLNYLAAKDLSEDTIINLINTIPTLERLNINNYYLKAITICYQKGIDF